MENKVGISGYKGISREPHKSSKQGFRWRFRVNVDGKLKTIKCSVNKEKLIKFADKWKLDNKYNT